MFTFGGGWGVCVGVFKPHKYLYILYSVELKFTEELQAKRVDFENLNDST